MPKQAGEFFYVPGFNTTIELHWRRTLVLYIYIRQAKLRKAMPLKGVTQRC